MSDTLTILKTRRSCRAYKPEHIEEEKLNAIMEAGTYAATGMGKQSPIILAVKDPEVRARLSKLNAAAMGMEFPVSSSHNLHTMIYSSSFSSTIPNPTFLYILTA